MDDDGFYMAELRGQRGLVPSNFLTEAPGQYTGGPDAARRADAGSRGSNAGDAAGDDGPAAGPTIHLHAQRLPDPRPGRPKHDAAAGNATTSTTTSSSSASRRGQVRSHGRPFRGDEQTDRGGDHDRPQSDAARTTTSDGGSGLWTAAGPAASPAAANDAAAAAATAAAGSSAAAAATAAATPTGGTSTGC